MKISRPPMDKYQPDSTLVLTGVTQGLTGITPR